MQQKKNKKTALVQAVDLLARQAHSRKALSDKLRRRAYEAEDIEDALCRLEARGYLNDEELCRHQFRRYFEESLYSVRQICYKLMNKGFADGLVRSCVPAGSEGREQRVAIRQLQGKFRSAASPEKMMQYLYGKGFSVGTARAAVDCFLQEEQD